MSEIKFYRHEHVIYDVKARTATSYHGINAAKRKARELAKAGETVRVSNQKLPPDTPMTHVPSPFSYMPARVTRARVSKARMRRVLALPGEAHE